MVLSAWRYRCLNLHPKRRYRTKKPPKILNILILTKNQIITRPSSSFLFQRGRTFSRTNTTKKTVTTKPRDTRFKDPTRRESRLETQEKETLKVPWVEESFEKAFLRTIMRLTMRIFGRRRHNVLRSAVFFLLWTTLTTVLASPTAIVTKIKTVPETKASVGNQDVVLGGFRTVKKDIATNDSHPDVPSVGRILRFAVPAIGVWIYFPMLSMIDTSIVGKVAGTQQQAALNPAIAVINYSAKLLVRHHRPL